MKSAHDTLLTLGVSPPNVRIVIENLIFAGDLIVRPGGSLIRPLYRIGSRDGQQHLSDIALNEWSGPRTSFMDEVPDIPGADDVVKWFGYWPTFHNAQILSITLNRSGESQVVIHAFERTSEG